MGRGNLLIENEANIGVRVGVGRVDRIAVGEAGEFLRGRGGDIIEGVDRDLVHGVREVARLVDGDVIHIVPGLRVEAADGEIEIGHLAGGGAAALEGVHAVADLDFGVLAIERNAAARGDVGAADEAGVLVAAVGVLLRDKEGGDGNGLVGHAEGRGALGDGFALAGGDHLRGDAALFYRPAVEDVVSCGFGDDGDQVARTVGAAARAAGDGDRVRAGINVRVIGRFGVHLPFGHGDPVDGAVLVEGAGEGDRPRGFVRDIGKGDEFGRGDVGGAELQFASPPQAGR